jgi:D-glycero-D-manno-heptose 1,7-bisphosphate phosphatase
MKRAVFLDRDGVLNRSNLVNGIPTPPRCVEEVEILDGVLEALQIIKYCNFFPVVVTNQPDVARRIVTKDSVEEINRYLGSKLGIEHFFTCFHNDLDECNCRKPKPGLLKTAANCLDIDLGKSFMVGDRWRDIEAGQAAGCECFFIDYKYDEKSPSLPFVRVPSLLEATRLILESIDDFC